MYSRKHEVKINAELKQLVAVERFIDGISDEYHIQNSYFSNISMAVTEAVTNAIVHGCKNDKTKQISLLFEPKQKGLTFTITDQGEGFDLSLITDPTDAAHNTDENSGRGIFLMKALSDEVAFSQGGRSIELSFNVGSIHPTLALDRISLLKAYAASKVNQSQFAH